MTWTAKAASPDPDWHQAFLKMLPAIRNHARVAFRHIRAEAREELIEEVVANAVCAYARLVKLGKADIAYASPLARYAIRQVKDNRRVGGRLNINDVSSRYCHQHKHVSLKRLDRYDHQNDEWMEVLIEDRHAGPFDIVRTKLDFSAWLRSLPLRLRRIARSLANGDRTGDVAKRFHLCDGRISQFRRELADSWHRFVGDEPGLA